jgi:uncharacterized protein YlxW (UPF0749 family)
MFPALSHANHGGRTVHTVKWSVSRRRLWLIIASIPLGIVLSVALQTRPPAPSASEQGARVVSATTILHLEAEQRELKATLAALRAQMAEAQRAAGARRVQLGDTSTQIADLKALAGLTAVRGAGIRITLDDSQSRSVPVGTDPNLLIVHDYDLRDVVALLWSNGAEAIAINGQRLVNSTSIYCVGSTILVNDTRLSPPYVVDAVGPPNMGNALGDRETLSRYKGLARQYGLGFNYAPVSDLTVQPYDGRLAPRGVAALQG